MFLPCPCLILHVSLHTLLGPLIQQAQQHVNTQNKCLRSSYNICQLILHQSNPKRSQTLLLTQAWHWSMATQRGRPQISQYACTPCFVPCDLCISFLLAHSPTAPDHLDMAAARQSCFCAFALGKQSRAKFLAAGGELWLQAVNAHPALSTTLFLHRFDSWWLDKGICLIFCLQRATDYLWNT
jgi:hypothetical protein